MVDRENAASIQGSLSIEVRLVPVWLLEGKLAIRFSPDTSRITSHFQLTVDLLMLRRRASTIILALSFTQA